MSNEPNVPSGPPADFTVQKDPFPKMIIACLAITAAGLFVIFSILVFDFITRQRHSGQFAPGKAVVGLPPQFPTAPPQTPAPLPANPAP